MPAKSSPGSARPCSRRSPSADRSERYSLHHVALLASAYSRPCCHCSFCYLFFGRRLLPSCRRGRHPPFEPSSEEFGCRASVLHLAASATQPFLPSVLFSTPITAGNLSGWRSPLSGWP